MRAFTQWLATGLLAAGLGAAWADPVEVKDRQQFADGLFRRSMFDLAAREYAALADAPGVAGLDSVLFRLGECYRRTQRPAEAEAVYKRLVEQFPQSPSVPRAQLQRALILMDAAGGAAEPALAAFEKLTQPGMPPEVRSAALYHWGETLERLKRPADALARYEQLSQEFGSTDYGTYAGLRTAWLLTQSGKAEERRRAMGIYLDLAHKAKDAKVAEEACFFAAQLSLADARYEESANLYQLLRNRYPASPRIAQSALQAGWANYYAGRYKEACDVLALVLDDLRHPGREEVLYVKANSLRMLEQRSEAVKAYDQQLAAFPQGRLAPAAHYERITTLYGDGRYQEVLKASSAFLDPPEEVLDNVLWMNAEAAVALQQPDTPRLLFGEVEASRSGVSAYGELLRTLTGLVSVDGWIIIGIIAVIGVMSIEVIVDKTLTLGRVSRANRHFLKLYAANPDDWLQLPAADSDPATPLRAATSPLQRLQQRAITELVRLLRTPGQTGFGRLTAESLEVLRSAIDSAIVEEASRLDRGLVLITMAVSAAPFLGLLGTVFGVMITFASVAAEGDVDVNTIAPGVASAMSTTVAGLVVAIPCLFAYNGLASQVRRLTDAMDLFANELLGRFVHAYGKQGGTDAAAA
jgi:biopolymer transport protein ExbB/TolQ/TolA-binding protein